MRYSSYKKITVLLFLIIQIFSFELFAQTNTEYFAIENTPLYQIKTSDVNLAIRYKKGQGIPIVFIHGSWDDHNSWLPVAEEINKTATNPIILYDRRGHSSSPLDKEQGTISIDVQDALSLLDALEIKKAHFIGHSYGANITIELANNHPDKVESIVLYEPPIFGILKGRSEYKDMLSEIQAEMQKSKTLLEQGHIEQGTFNFIEKVAFGKGSWYSIFDQRARNTMTASYATWLDQANDPERLNIKPENLNQFNGKITLITGSDSILVYPAVAKTIKQKVNSIELQTIQGAGHGGLISHPKQTADLISKHLEQL
ncbi:MULTISPECIES: alpha/beta fold hydrolase [Myroides]|uniref:alpha/beta fold hydrolase n=1 Tax=Myroides TaxID=76831 RepID=UPI0013237538|nr:MULTISPECIES: alpha/beta hydrolase [Myroides]MDM1444451.1 alpha/beta hydrolase [Myroides odoratimimus]MVX36591.1 alpha/beta fold hydrolase [Myroides sp. LoEW2-1]